jgi:hypothetical protein
MHRSNSGSGGGLGRVLVGDGAVEGMTSGSPLSATAGEGGERLAELGHVGLASWAAMRCWAARRRWRGGGLLAAGGLRGRAAARACYAVGSGRWVGQLGRLSCMGWSGCWAAVAGLLASLDGLGRIG